MNASEVHCKVWKTPAFEMHIFDNGDFRLLPPPEWIAELVELLEKKIISHDSAKKVIEIWRNDRMKRIGNAIHAMIKSR